MISQEKCLTVACFVNIVRMKESFQDAMADGIRTHLNEFNVRDESTSCLYTIQRRNHRSFAFKVYMPLVFHKIRHCLKYWSFLEDLVFEPSPGSKSLGKSGSIFFHNQKGNLLFKTISFGEKEFLVRNVRAYHKYISKRFDTAIVPIYGLYRISFQRTRRAYFIVMQNALPTEFPLSKKFDVKGSLVGRSSGDPVKAPVLKDIEFVTSCSISLSTHKHEAFISVIESDARFLSSIGSMDYSLILGVYKPDSDLNSSSGGIRDFHGGIIAKEQNGQVVLFYGIIDFLQEFTPIKELEHEIKSMIFKPMTVSCIPPDEYATRFISFIRYWTLPKELRPKSNQAIDVENSSVLNMMLD